MSPELQFQLPSLLSETSQTPNFYGVQNPPRSHIVTELTMIGTFALAMPAVYLNLVRSWIESGPHTWGMVGRCSNTLTVVDTPIFNNFGFTIPDADSLHRATFDFNLHIPLRLIPV